ncbi:thiamine pyrophosphate-binding protein [Streptomyces sp. BF23-18]|uniref:thiamine pyrophosphate-binding protein n=1 Tax=Streptomyces sp. BF23-18 TaxID=3240282 RepID=UPI0034E533C0
MGRRPALALLDILRGEGVDRVFGNPGTTELPFLTALAEAEEAPEYVLGVHEGAVVSMADGYARAPSSRATSSPPSCTWSTRAVASSPARPSTWQTDRPTCEHRHQWAGTEGSRSRRESRPRVRTP